MEMGFENKFRPSDQTEPTIKSGTLRHRDPDTGEILWSEPTLRELKPRGRSLIYNLNNIVIEPIEIDLIEKKEEPDYFEI